jgi:alkylated DNA repair dioxygenase AlkB
MNKIKHKNDRMNKLPKGLVIIPNYITQEQEEAYLKRVYAAQWSNSLKRRTQHFGYSYDYKSRNAAKKVEPLPGYTHQLCERLVKDGYFEKFPEQLIVNEYTPGQGISAHVDSCVFGDPVVSLSLSSATCIVFTELSTQKRVDLYVKPRTLLIMSGDSRWKWSHAIPSRRSDYSSDLCEMVPRDTRVSLTFRILKK